MDTRTVIVLTALVNTLACLSQLVLQQVELKLGRLSKRHSLIPGTNQFFNHWQDSHCQIWGDLIGQGMIMSGFADLANRGRIAPIEWLFFGVIALGGSVLWYLIGTDPKYKSNWSFPTAGEISWGGKVHLVYFGLCLAVSTSCLYHISVEDLRGQMMHVVLAGWATFGVATAVDIALGHKNQLHTNSRKDSPSLVELVKTCRLRGTVFTFFFTLSGFIMFDVHNVNWLVATLTGVSFSLIHASIMTFNDWHDREHDPKKGKTLAHDHPGSFWSYWVGLTTAALGWILVLGFSDTGVAMFCLIVLAMGLLYSLVENTIVLNNLIVAFCGASPMLSGSIYLHNVKQSVWLWYAVFFLLILAREIIKDVEDAKIDLGYKSTLATNFGVSGARTASVVLIVMAGVLGFTTGKLYEAIMLQLVLIYQVTNWNTTTNPTKPPLLFFDVIISVVTVSMVVAQKYGTREVAMFDFWSVEHLLFGVMLTIMVKRFRPKLRTQWTLITVLVIAYGWEALEYAMENGVIGQGIARWKNGMEHWSNRLIGDPGLALLGAHLQTRWQKTWRWAIIPWIVWGMANYLAPDSMYIQRIVTELFK